ncbi:MAG: hypothetical protein LKE51_02445 [Selenomonas sp.]|nr:hypothetical protein [Selenomonas sp.]
MDKASIFAIYTRTGDERMLKHLILERLSNFEQADLFVPQKVVYSRIRGHWRKTVKNLFPGYLFLRSKDPEHIFFELKSVPKLSTLLHDGDYNFVPLNEPEKNFMNLIYSLSVRELWIDHDAPSKLILPASLVRVVPCVELQPGDVFLPRGKQDEVLKVINGPLLKLASYVSKVDYSNRKVALDVDVFGVHELHIGIRMLNDFAKMC